MYPVIKSPPHLFISKLLSQGSQQARHSVKLQVTQTSSRNSGKSPMYSTALQVQADWRHWVLIWQVETKLQSAFLLSQVSLSGAANFILYLVQYAWRTVTLPHAFTVWVAQTLAQFLVYTNLVAERSSCQYPSSFVQSSATIDHGPESTARPHRSTSRCRPAAPLSSSSRTHPVRPRRSFSPAWSLRCRTASWTNVRGRPPAACRWR